MTTATTAILAPELLAHLTASAPLAVGDLAVVTDYKGRTLGACVTHIMGGTIVGKINDVSQAGPARSHCYRTGDKIPRDLQFWTKAI